jgi:hypothetical protein
LSSARAPPVVVGRGAVVVAVVAIPCSLLHSTAAWKSVRVEG